MTSHAFGRRLGALPGARLDRLVVEFVAPDTADPAVLGRPFRGALLAMEGLGLELLFARFSADVMAGSAGLRCCGRILLGVVTAGTGAVGQKGFRHVGGMVEAEGLKLLAVLVHADRGVGLIQILLDPGW